jgi:hypothetical protein
VLANLDSNDSRMQQVFYAYGKLWGALDTAVEVGGEQRAGIAWFVLQPQVRSNSVRASTMLERAASRCPSFIRVPGSRRAACRA